MNGVPDDEQPRCETCGGPVVAGYTVTSSSPPRSKIRMFKSTFGGNAKRRCLRCHPPIQPR